jgi:DNA replication and repair protein RecF
VLTERNFLLRSLRNRSYDPSELAFWDQRLVEHGSYLIWKRRRVLEQMSGEARLIHLGLTGEMDSLQLEYVSTVSGGNAPSYQLELPASAGEETQADRTDVQSAVSGAFTARLREMRGRELEQGMTLVGPHRDDLRFWVNRVDMNIYDSRGQQRTVALSLKLAEMELVAKIKGERPVLLLDDVISELDEAHRGHLLRALDTVQQVVMTATDLAHFSPDFVAKATLWRVSGGRIENEAIQP